MNGNEGRFLDALYRGVTNGEELDRALQILQDMFGCRGAVLVSVDSQNPTASFNSTAGWLKENLQLYLEKYAHIDPAPAAFMRLPAGTASTTDRIFTVEQRNSHRFYHEFFLPMGAVESLAGNLYSDQGNLSMIVVMRSAERKQFDDDDIAHMERLMPHITRAVQLRRAFFKVDAKSLGLQATVDRLRAGIVLLDGKGAAVFVNTAMQAIAQRGDGFMLDRGGRPLPTNIEARRRFDALLGDVNGGGAGGIVAVRRMSGARDYVVLVAPAPPSSAQSDWEREAGGGGAIVLVHDPEAQPAVMAEVLEQGLSLPKGAARLVAALAADDDLKSYAEREGVTIHTARFHLRTALARTGARTQAELVRLAVRLLRDFALAEPKA